MKLEKNYRMPLIYNSLAYGLFMAAIFFSACGGKKQTPQLRADPPTVVDVIVVKSTTISNNIEANGTVVPYEYVELHPEISGRLTYLNVPEGAHVEQGTVIARINDADLIAQLNKSKVQLDLAEKTEERLRKLLAVEGVNQADYDAALNEVNSLKADINYTQAQIDKTVIRAPFSGVIGLKQVSPGAYVNSSNIIATIQQVDRLKIDFTIPEEYNGYVKKGSYVDVLVDETKGTRQKALIIATEPQVDVNTRNLKVRTILQNGDANPGAFVKVYISAGTDKKSVMVPTNSIIPDAMNNKVVTIKKGKATFVDVQTGVRKSSLVEVTSGLHAGDTVVVSGVLFARPGASLQVRTIKQLEDLVQP